MKKLFIALFILFVFLLVSGMLGTANSGELKTPKTKHLFGAISGEEEIKDKQGKKIKIKVPKVERIKKYSPKKPMPISIVLPTRNKEELKTFLKELKDPKSPNYRKYLSVEQFTERFGPTQEDYQQVVDFAKANKMKIKKEHVNRLVLDIEGDIKDVEKMFNVELNEYSHPKEKRNFVHPDKEPTLDLPVNIWRVAGLDNYSIPVPAFVEKGKKGIKDFLPTTYSTKKPAEDTFEPAADCTGTCTGTGPTGWYIGSDMRKVYYPENILTGKGQSVAIVSFTAYDPADVTLYFNTIGETFNIPLVNVSIDGASVTCTNPDCTSAEVEPILDIIYAASMAPKLDSIRMYTAGGRSWEGWEGITFVNDTALFNQIATDNISKQISISWAWFLPDYSGNDPIFEQMEAQGQVIFAASGDWGTWYPDSAMTVSTPAINTTGANLLIVHLSTYNGSSVDPAIPSATGITDSKGNTWNYLGAYGETLNGYSRFYYSIPTSVGSEHTVSFTSNVMMFTSMSFSAFSTTLSGGPDVNSDQGYSSPGTSILCYPYHDHAYTTTDNMLCFSGLSTGWVLYPNNPVVYDSFTKLFGVLSPEFFIGYENTAYKDVSSSIIVSGLWGTGPGGVFHTDPNPKNNACSGICFPKASGTATTLISSTQLMTSGGSHLLYTYPAEHPSVTSVGGTNLVTGTNQVWVSENTWSDTGGGYSPAGYEIPTWQPTSIMNLGNNGSTTYRNAPDVAMMSGPKFYTCRRGSCVGGGAGTSFATPMWAAFNALMNQQSMVNSVAVVGFLNPILYPIGTGASYSSVFNDITTGTNSYSLSMCTGLYTPFFCCSGVATGSCTGSLNYYNAATGYDLVTGWGSPKGAALIDLITGPLNDTTAPVVTITTASPQSIENDSLTVIGIASDGITISGCKFRVGAEPDSTHGTACTSSDEFINWSCSTSGYSSGSNTLYVACYDSIPNYSTGDFITVNYAAPDPLSSKVWGGKVSGCIVR